MSEFKNDRIVVRFDESRCCHAGECVKALPNVFDPSRQPWIEVNAAPVRAIAETIGRCPSGALSYELTP